VTRNRRLSGERWRAVSPLLDAVLDLPAEARAAWLASLRVEDEALAEDVESLLQEHSALQQEGFLEGPSPEPPQASLAGLVVGAYTLRSLIGQGGMGSVWLAERSDGRFQGVAAVKLLNASLVGHEGEARLRREGNILARLRHPHVAHLIDAGLSPTGQPYLVLEHVLGDHIDRYCDARGLDVDARIRLFLDVLDAMAHAHANLIVHRDLKPSNVLVARDGQVKLLDFGIAKLLEAEGGGEAIGVTRDGVSALTPEYAAPEQLTGGAITTATDVYALGVLLYVLLTGRHPAGDGAGSVAKLLKAIVETEPPRASDAVGSEATAGRAANPRKLQSRLQGDLDNIVAKALRKVPADRYASVAALADDLRRHLRDQPVSARADSLAYRAAKFARRNRGVVAAAVVAALAALFGIAGIAWQAREAQKQRDEAQAQLARTIAAKEFMGFLLTVGAPAGEKFSVSDLLEQSETLIDKQFAGSEALRAEMLVDVGQLYLSAEHWDKAVPLFERAAEIARRSKDPALQARALCPLALVSIYEGEDAKGTGLMSQALSGLPDDPRYALPRAECLIAQANFGYKTGDGEAMIRSADAALELLEKAPVSAVMKRIDALSGRAYGQYLTRQNRKAEATYAQVMEGLTKIGRERTMAASDILNNWSLVHYQGDIVKSEPLARRSLELRRAIEGAQSVTPTVTFNWAGILFRLARYTEAESVYQETIRTARARHEQRIEFDAMMELADVYVSMGELERASAQLAKLTPFLDSPHFDHYRRAGHAYFQGRLALARGQPGVARTRFTEAIERFDQRKAKLAMNVLALNGLARSELQLGDRAAAERAVERGMVLAESFVEKDAPSYLVGLSQSVLGEIQLANGQEEAAQQSFRSAMEHLQRTLGPDNPATRDARNHVMPGTPGREP
jgi:serine/threonine protein kinase